MMPLEQNSTEQNLFAMPADNFSYEKFPYNCSQKIPIHVALDQPVNLTNQQETVAGLSALK